MRLKLLFAVLISALFGYSAFWFFLSGSTEVFLENAKADFENRGVQFDYSGFETSGFPFRLVTTFQNPALDFKNGFLEVRFDAPGLETVTHPWSLGHFVAFSEGARATMQFGSARDPLVLSAAKTSISLSAQSTEAYRLSMIFENATATSGQVFPFPENWQTFGVHLRKTPNPEGGDEALFEPRQLEMFFEGKTRGGDTFTLNSSFRGDFVPKLTSEGLRQWQQSGGTLEVEGFEFSSLAGKVWATGSLTLDDEVRPLGSVGLKGKSPGALLAFFEGAGLIGPVETALLQAFFEMLPDQPESLPEIGLTLQDGYLMLGPLQLVKYGPIIPD